MHTVLNDSYFDTGILHVSLTMRGLIHSAYDYWKSDTLSGVTFT